jgi:uncharacterized membrane protein YgdD (TMEM256/DUF423 family)
LLVNIKVGCNFSNKPIQSNCNMNSIWLSISGICAFLAVTMGAFGAHLLSSKISESGLKTMETGIKYQFYHSLALILVYILSTLNSSVNYTWSARLFLAGIILFSGSLYIIACKDLLGIENLKFIGPITPVGGLCFLTGWALLIIQSFK